MSIIAMVRWEISPSFLLRQYHGQATLPTARYFFDHAYITIVALSLDEESGI
jgi:hypothetical protein